MPVRHLAVPLLALSIAATSLAQAGASGLTTIAERSGFLDTGRMDEVERLCAAFAEAHPGRVRCERFGTTPEMRPLLALVASADGTLEPDRARARARPVVLAVGGIHSGEIDGKDAGFLLLRELLEAEALPGVLEHVTFVFVPVFNVDGHERFGPNNRPNQVGPREMGWRTTSQNLNLNRDWVKADAPEMQAMLRLLAAWDPIVMADLHVTDGAEFRHDVAVMVDPAEVGPPALAQQGRKLRDEVMEKLAEMGHLPLPFYPSFVVDEDPSTGFRTSAMAPRFSNGYWGTRERLGVLVETHSWKDYATRVRATRNTLVVLLQAAARDGAAWRAAARDAEQHAGDSAGRDVTLSWEHGPRTTPIVFQGVAYTREPSAISGGLITRYRRDEPEEWTVPLQHELRPKLVVAAPAGGYLVPPGQAEMVAAKLDLHGISHERLGGAWTGEADAFRATSAKIGTGTFEGRVETVIDGKWARETRSVAPGALWVPIAQPRARLLMTLLEPQCADSLAAWGFFNAWFERKEYMEAYVAEQVARDMLAADPALAAEFRTRLATDAAFAKDPSARLDFFYKRHPSWDDRAHLYPVLRVEARPEVPALVERAVVPEPEPRREETERPSDEPRPRRQSNPPR